MATLPKRDFKLTVHDRELLDLDIEFSVTRSLDRDANSADFTIYNLTAETRKHLQQIKGGIIIQLHAGYKETGLGLIFLGQLREIVSARQGPDWVTRITSGDGDGQSKAVSFSIGPGSKLSTVIQKLIGELKDGIGNAQAAILGGEFLTKLNNTFPSGGIVHGRTDQELDRILRTLGKTYSVQNGNIQILDSGKSNNETAHLVTVNTGLIGSPEISSVKNAAGKKIRGGCKFRSLLTSEIYPGRQVRVEGENLNGFFRVNTAQYSGQINGPDWYVDVESSPVV